MVHVTRRQVLAGGAVAVAGGVYWAYPFCEQGYTVGEGEDVTELQEGRFVTAKGAVVESGEWITVDTGTEQFMASMPTITTGSPFREKYENDALQNSCVSITGKIGSKQDGVWVLREVTGTLLS